MVRHPAMAHAHFTRGGSTRAASRLESVAAQPRVAESGGPADERASGQGGDDRRTSRHATEPAVRASRSTAFRESAGEKRMRENRQQSRSRGPRVSKSHRRRRETTRWSSRQKKAEFVKTAYGNWIRWTPPAPKTEEALPARAVAERSSSGMRVKRAAREEKTRKLEAAHAQLKRKVKALEAKCVGLQEQLDAGTAAVRGDCVASAVEEKNISQEPQQCAPVAALDTAVLMAAVADLRDSKPGGLQGKNKDTVNWLFDTVVTPSHLEGCTVDNFAAAQTASRMILLMFVVLIVVALLSETTMTLWIAIATCGVVQLIGCMQILESVAKSCRLVVHVAVQIRSGRLIRDCKVL